MSHAVRFAVSVSLAVSVLFWSAVSQSAEPPWKVGLASVKITPEGPVRLVGYSSRTKPSEGVALDLFAKALALEDQDGRRAVIVTSDLIGFRGAFAEAICRRISRKTGLERHQILLNSSHTHCAPYLETRAEELEFPDDQVRATVTYSRGLEDQLVDLVVRALERPVPARLSRGTGVVNFVMNRREFTERGVQLGVNPRGLADRSVPLLRVDDADGKLLAVLFGAACHNTTLTGKHFQISADFAGYSQALVEREYPGAQAMFMQNCGGDANPYPRGSEEIAVEHGDELGREVLRVLETELKPVLGPLRTEYGLAALPLQAAPPREEIEKMKESGGWRGFVGGKMLSVLEGEGKLSRTYSTPIAVWQFGEDLTLVGLPGEVVVDYVTLLEKALGPNRLWVAAYCNDVFGYLPSARVLAEGGYETRGLYAGGVGFFSEDAQDVVVRTVKELARKAGRFPGAK